MEKLKEKYEKWMEKVISGDRRYFMITRTDDDRWYFVSGNHAEQILSLRIATDEENGLRSEYEYSENHVESEKMSFTIIVKDDNKMIIQIGDEEKAFGIKDAPYPVKSIVVYCKTATVHTFLFGSQPACVINTVFVSVSRNEDTIEPCIEGFYRELKSARPAAPESVVGFDG